jgi:hypothetical protein
VPLHTVEVTRAVAVALIAALDDEQVDYSPRITLGSPGVFNLGDE